MNSPRDKVTSRFSGCCGHITDLSTREKTSVRIILIPSDGENATDDVQREFKLLDELSEHCGFATPVCLLSDTKIKSISAERKLDDYVGYVILDVVERKALTDEWYLNRLSTAEKN